MATTRRIRKTIIEAVFERLKVLEEAARFEGATFALPGSPPWSPEAVRFNADVRAATEHYRRVWLQEPLADVLTTLKEELWGTEALDEDVPA